MAEGKAEDKSPQSLSVLGQALPFLPENTRGYYIERRNTKKRNYIFDYGKSRTCDHPRLQVIARGGIVYRCLDCNYAFHIVGGYQQPLHNEVIQAAFNLLVFSKEFGSDALGEVLRRPIGQHDGSPHKPVLPEGMSFMDVLKLLEGVDVNTEDRGASQVYKLLDEVWVGPKERALEEKRVARLEAKRQKQLAEAEEKKKEKLLSAGNPSSTKPKRNKGKTNRMPRLRTP